MKVKPYMNSDILLEMAALFYLPNLYLKQDIGMVYVMVDFICMGLLDLWGALKENYKMKNSCQQWESNPVPSDNEGANSLGVALLN